MKIVFRGADALPLSIVPADFMGHIGIDGDAPHLRDLATVAASLGLQKSASWNEVANYKADINRVRLANLYGVSPCTTWAELAEIRGQRDLERREDRS